MIEHRPFLTLGRSRHDGLDARHHFSIATYHDPGRMGWGALRVWNDDELAPQTGFPMHLHRDMEIVTYVRHGAITHADSLGNAGRTPAGAIQVISAGRGIRHSEFNREHETTSLFQMWIRPRMDGTEPRWRSMRLRPWDEAGDEMQVLASGFAGDRDALALGADARVLAVRVPTGACATYPLAPNRQLYIVAARGSARVNGLHIAERDGAAVSNEAALSVHAIEACELMLVETL